MDKTTRYNRQTILPEVGLQGQEKLARSAVLCVGAGGLGCPALPYLAGAGIGHIGIVDFDSVEESNLHRQTLFSVDQIGMNKAKAAADKLRALNPNIRISAFPEKVTAQNARQILAPFDIIIDGTDNFTTKFLLNDAALIEGKPLIYGAVLGFEGQVSVFNNGDNNHASPCYRCLFPHPPENHIPNCAQAGVIGAVAGITGTIQAMETIKLIIGHKSFQPLSGKLYCLDARTMQSRTLALTKNPACPACASPQSLELEERSRSEDNRREKNKTTKENKGSNSMNDTGPSLDGIAQISISQMQQRTDALIVDVREQEEWDEGFIENAILFPLSRLIEGEKPDWNKNTDIILYCRSGQRSQHAALMLKGMGYTCLSNVTGGYLAWIQSAAAA